MDMMIFKRLELSIAKNVVKNSVNNVVKNVLLGCVALIITIPVTSNSVSADEVPLDRIIAVVNNDVIMLSEVRSVVNRAMKKQSGSKLTSNNPKFLKEALDHLILTRLQVQKAKQIGIKIDDTRVDEAMLSIAKQNKLSLAQFRTALIKEGLDYKQFREKIREKIQIDTLKQRQKSRRNTISEAEVDNLIKSESQRLNKDVQYHLQDILISAPNGISVARFNAAHKKANQLRNKLLGQSTFLIAKTLKKYNVSGQDLGWQSTGQLSPAYARALSLMQTGEISPLVRDTKGFHLLKIVDQKGGQRKITQQAHVRHILISADDPQARIKILQLRQKILAGEKFAVLAKKHSADKGSALKGGDLGTVDPSVFVPPFANAVKTLSIKSLSQPVQSKFGWHLIQVLERTKSDQTRDALKAQAQTLISKKKQSDKYNSWLQGLRDNAFIEYRL